MVQESEMSVFGSIMNKIFGRDTAGSGSAGGTGATQASPRKEASAAASTAPASRASTASSGSASGGQSVDVEAVLSGMAAKKGQKLDWRHSIVDLMKLLDLDSSLAARKELARELKYAGDTNDSAKMNMWLHNQVMVKLAENGGKVPASLRA
jgi:hypothetical protein